MCIDKVVLKYNNKPGRMRKQHLPWGGPSHTPHTQQRYWRKLVNCIETYRCKKRLFEF